MDNQHQQRVEAALAVATKILHTRFAGASSIFAAGSILRGEGAAFSDIDLVVIFPKLERAWRESFMLDGFPVEAFVHDAETLGYFIDKDVESGCPVMVNMIATGTIIGDGNEAARAMQEEARHILRKGPLPLAGLAYDTMRYLLSDLADDLRDSRPADEVAAIAVQLHPRLIDLILLGRGQWTGRGKWGPRLLKRFDASLAQAVMAALGHAARGDGTALLKLADAELERHGGRHFDGYRSDAPVEARRSVLDNPPTSNIS